jgi:hypothetical protein
MGPGEQAAQYHHAEEVLSQLVRTAGQSEINTQPVGECQCGSGPQPLAHLRSHLLKVGSGRGQGICFHQLKAHISQRSFYSNNSIALDIAKPKKAVHATEIINPNAKAARLSFSRWLIAQAPKVAHRFKRPIEIKTSV